MRSYSASIACFRHDGALEEVLGSVLVWGVDAFSLGALWAYRDNTDFVPLPCSPAAADDDLQLKGLSSALGIILEPSSDVEREDSLFAGMDFIAEDEGRGTFPLPEYSFKNDFTVPGSAPGFP